MTDVKQSLWQELRGLTLREWLVVICIVEVLAFIILAQSQWVSDGDVTLPVRVLVFDLVDAKPITQAKVAIIKAPPAATLDDVHTLHERLPSALDRETDQAGAVVISFKFATNSSNARPVNRAQVDNAWVMVEAGGYGGAVVPLRYESQPTAELRKTGELLVTVGLIRPK